MKPLLFIAAGALVITACGKAPPARSAASGAPATAAVDKAPPTVRTSDPAIRSLHDYPAQLGVTLYYEDTGDELMIMEVGSAVENIGKAMQAGAPEGRTAKSVVVFVDTAGVDRLGNTGDLHVMELVFAADDLRKAKFENLDSDSTLALASKLSISTQAGAKILVGYCRGAVKANGGTVTRFCDLVADRLAD